MDELNVQFELADPPELKATLEGEQDNDSPDDGLADSDRDTLPTNPPRLVNVTVEDPLLPDWKPTLDGFAVIE